jgi:hypothetical protein
MSDSRVLDYMYVCVRGFFRRRPEYRDALRAVEVNTLEQKTVQEKAAQFLFEYRLTFHGCSKNKTLTYYNVDCI